MAQPYARRTLHQQGPGAAAAAPREDARQAGRAEAALERSALASLR
ncbi:hypothetical protein [Arthrobacter zhaoguopingii]|nr:hypothetical protein [Arthrobacter zhaoguopingii]